MLDHEKCQANSGRWVWEAENPVDVCEEVSEDIEGKSGRVNNVQEKVKDEKKLQEKLGREPSWKKLNLDMR